MGVLVSVEGLDGAGKRTLITGLVTALEARGLRVDSLAFPRYGRSVHADLAAEALRGAHGDLAGSVNAMAVLFALDRAGAADELAKSLADHDVVLLDRYVASNAAYNAARLGQSADGEMVRWVGELEFGRFELPVPRVQLLLDVPVEVASVRARRRAELDSTRELDAYERDSGLQERTAAVYRDLARRDWYGTWWVFRFTGEGSGRITEEMNELAARLAALVAN
ncbi:dTMP kinase [Nocardia sp. NPDC024068]|uniref:dTMP kinase n=1 Tax=Nocardia sp. NPDC024068 TaxID=3157197 RepID=UPI0033D9A5AF